MTTKPEAKRRRVTGRGICEFIPKFPYPSFYRVVVNADYTRHLLGKRVYLSYLDGKSMVGTMKGWGTYTLLIDRSESELIVYKHALRYVRLAKEDEA